MTQTTLARETGFSVSYINDLIRGRRSPNGRVISRVAAVLKVPKSMLIPATEDAA
ncbi:Xre family transcriptional regulator [Corynebacterium humireducens NBRC 106098 = DSM 45392]|uniref:Xre family transcriptional regulator n=2 Tax=Corynebacterium humireducens TaxID=1223514 RepID=A0A0B5D1N8_9CORY|nr:Xre family transcriptional regulator [Corynebacterium humireducens NBRC 106098 = DSM 45392]